MISYFYNRSHIARITYGVFIHSGLLINMLLRYPGYVILSNFIINLIGNVAECWNLSEKTSYFFQHNASNVKKISLERLFLYIKINNFLNMYIFFILNLVSSDKIVNWFIFTVTGADHIIHIVNKNTVKKYWTTILPDLWYHYALTYDNSSNYQMFLNGCV